MDNLLLKALFKRQQVLAESDPLPQLKVEKKAVHVSPSHIRDYQNMFGYSANNYLPLPYLFLLAHQPLMQFLTKPAWPLKLLGLVHKRNTFEQIQPIPIDSKVDIEISLADQVFVSSGRMFTLTTRFKVDNRVMANLSAQFVARGQSPITAKTPSNRRLLEQANASSLIGIHYPESIGRQYAKLSGDYNPIHLHTLTAKILGFKRAVAHGMYSAAYIYEHLGCGFFEQKHNYEIEFLTPIYLPKKAKLLSNKNQGICDFTLWSGLVDKPHAHGRLLLIE